MKIISWAGFLIIAFSEQKDNHKKVSYWKNWLVIVYSCLLLVWDFLLYLSPDKEMMANFLFNTGYGLLFLMGTFLGIWGAVKANLSSNVGKALLFIGIGEAMYAIGLFIWTYYNVFTDVEVPYPSLADLFFILFIPIVAMGCFKLYQTVSTSISSKKILEGAIMFAVFSIVILGFISRPDLSSDLSPLIKFTNTFYPLGDSILLTIAYMTFRAGGGKVQKGTLILVFGLVFQVIADILFSVRTADQTYWNGGISDTFYTLSAGAITLALVNIYEGFAKPEATSLS